MIYVSTGGIKSRTAPQVALEFLQHEIYNVELSGGMSSSSIVSEIENLPTEINLQIHNYFPPPKDPFVFNLASTDESIFAKSYNHVLSAVNLVSKLKLNTYSFHGGYRISPAVDELGGNLGNHRMANRDQALEIFNHATLKLANYAGEMGVNLLVENNVLTQSNLEAFGENPLLFTEPQELITYVESMPANIAILMDVGHLSVSASTLKFDKVNALELMQPFIGAYHLSENDCLSDSNDPVRGDSWFWPNIRKGLNYYSLEVYGERCEVLKNQVDLCLKMLDN